MLEARHLFFMVLHFSLKIPPPGQNCPLKLTVNLVWEELMSDFQLGKLNKTKHEFKTLLICGITKSLARLMGLIANIVTSVGDLFRCLIKNIGVYLLPVWDCCSPLVVGTWTQLGFSWLMTLINESITSLLEILFFRTENVTCTEG